MLSGPNYGDNLGAYLYTLAGTLGATYTAIERGIPAIGISGGYSVQTPYYWTNSTTKAGLKDPATIMAQLSANLAQNLITKAEAKGLKRVLPLGYGLNVNIPLITSYEDSSCVNPPFIQTRMTGSAVVDRAAYNETTGLFHYAELVDPGVNQCINGDCSLPGEQAILNAGCQSSVSVFTVDYDAPIGGSCNVGPDVRSLLTPVVQYVNGSAPLLGGLGNNTAGGSAGNSTVTPVGPTASIVPTSDGFRFGVSGGLFVAGLVLAFII